MPFSFEPDRVHILESERDSIAPTRFVIKTLTLSERVRMGNLILRGNQGDAAEQFDLILDICKLGIRKIEGERIPQSLNVPEILDRVTDPGVVAELARVIANHNRMTPEQEKNSDGQCAPLDPGGSAEPAQDSRITRSGAGKRRRSNG
ncbi:MAG: hypothetical protein HQL99_14175 [Magnetococcales bacterium]|nr:hypothetical protein [Magnetococcales bacterium]